MTNMEHFEGLPLIEAWKRYDAAYSKGEIDRGVDFTEWLVGHEYLSPNLELRLVAYQYKPVTGYLLEFLMSDGTWKATEFDCGWEPTIDDDCFAAWDNGEVRVGFFPALGETVWLSSSCDWNSRLGVGFNAETTPKTFDSPIGVWGGEVVNGCPKDTLWRVRKVTIDGAWSDKAKRFFRRYPNALPHMKTRCVKIDLEEKSATYGVHKWTEWFCLESEWTNPYNRDGKDGRQNWDNVREYQKWCGEALAADTSLFDKWCGCCPTIRINGDVLNDGWGSDIVYRITGDFSEADSKAWGDALESVCKNGGVTTLTLTNTTNELVTTFTPYVAIMPDADSIADFGKWADEALKGL